MKRLMFFGNVVAVFSVIGVGLLSLYSIYLITQTSKYCAWIAIVICIVWFVSLLIRTYAKKRINV